MLPRTSQAVWGSAQDYRGARVVLKNVSWKKVFQRLWQVYACLVFCFAIFLRHIDGGYSNPTFSEEWIAVLMRT